MGVLVRPFIIDTVHVLVSVRATLHRLMFSVFAMDRDESKNSADIVQAVYHLLNGKRVIRKKARRFAV